MSTNNAQCQSQIAIKDLGVCYEEGCGLIQNYQEARRLYSLAAANGFALATDDLKRIDEKIRTECPLLGKRVVITGTSREDMNGRTGVATSFDHARGRYVVELGDRSRENEREKLKLKPGNLAVAIKKKKKKK